MKVVRNKRGGIIQIDNYKLHDYVRFEMVEGGFADITVKINLFWENARKQVFVSFEKLPTKPFQVGLFTWNGSRLATQQEIDAYIKNGGPIR